MRNPAGSPSGAVEATITLHARRERLANPLRLARRAHVTNTKFVSLSYTRSNSSTARSRAISSSRSARTSRAWRLGKSGSLSSAPHQRFRREAARRQVRLPRPQARRPAAPRRRGSRCAGPPARTPWRTSGTPQVAGSPLSHRRPGAPCAEVSVGLVQQQVRPAFEQRAQRFLARRRSRWGCWGSTASPAAPPPSASINSEGSACSAGQRERPGSGG